MLQRAINVIRRFGMKCDSAGTGLGKLGDHGIYGFYHQMDIDRRLDAIASKRFADHGAERQIRYAVIVHDIKVNLFGPASMTAATSSPRRAKSAGFGGGL